MLQVGLPLWLLAHCEDRQGCQGCQCQGYQRCRTLSEVVEWVLNPTDWYSSRSCRASSPACFLDSRGGASLAGWLAGWLAGHAANGRGVMRSGDERRVCVVVWCAVAEEASSTQAAKRPLPSRRPVCLRRGFAGTGKSSKSHRWSAFHFPYLLCLFLRAGASIATSCLPQR